MKDTVCPTGSLVALDTAGLLVIPARCKRWACDHCRRKKAKELAARIMATPARRFITLTVRPNATLTPQEMLDELNRSWRSLWKRIQRFDGPAAAGYVKIVEVTASGTPHLHIAAQTGFLPQRWLSANWNDLTGSPIVDVRVIRSREGIARYLAKYLTKQGPALEHRRKFSASRGWLRPFQKPLRAPGELPWQWRFNPLEPAALIPGLILSGYRPLNIPGGNDFFLAPPG